LYLSIEVETTKNETRQKFLIKQPYI